MAKYLIEIDAITLAELPAALNTLNNRDRMAAKAFNISTPQAINLTVDRLVRSLNRAVEAPVEPAPKPLGVGDFVKRKFFSPNSHLGGPLQIVGEDVHLGAGPRWKIRNESEPEYEWYISKELVEPIKVHVTPAQPEVWTVLHDDES
jgi:hypothetical protein